MNSFIKRLTTIKPIIFIDQILYRIKINYVFAAGTQLTYFLILSIFPFIIVFLNILSYTSLVQEEVLLNLITYMPYETQKIIYGFVNEIVLTSSQELLSIAAFLGIWTASSGIKPVIKAINRAYGYEENRSYFHIKFLSIIFTIALLVLLTLVFLSLVFGELLGNRLFGFFGRPDIFLAIWDKVRIIIPLVYMILIFTLLYKFSPCVEKRKQISLRSTLPGAIFTTLGWMITSIAFSYYVNNFGKYTVTYGSLGGIIILLVWFYISSIIIVLGGEINGTINYFKVHGFKFHKDKSMLAKYMY